MCQPIRVVASTSLVQYAARFELDPDAGGGRAAGVVVEGDDSGAGRPFACGLDHHVGVDAADDRRVDDSGDSDRIMQGAVR